VQTLIYATVTATLVLTFLYSSNEMDSVLAALVMFGLPQALAIPFSTASALVARRNSIRAARLAFWASAIAMPTFMFRLLSACGAVAYSPIYLVIFVAAWIQLLLISVLPSALLIASAIYSRKILLRAKAVKSGSAARS